MASKAQELFTLNAMQSMQVRGQITAFEQLALKPLTDVLKKLEETSATIIDDELLRKGLKITDLVSQFYKDYFTASMEPINKKLALGKAISLAIRDFTTDTSSFKPCTKSLYEQKSTENLKAHFLDFIAEASHVHTSIGLFLMSTDENALLQYNKKVEEQKQLAVRINDTRAQRPRMTEADKKKMWGDKYIEGYKKGSSQKVETFNSTSSPIIRPT